MSERKRTRVLVLSNDVIEAKMAGTGIRCMEISRVLGGVADVTLAIPNAVTLEGMEGVQVVSYSFDDPAGLKEAARGQDVIVLSGFALNKFRFLNQSRARVVVDGYDPFLIENLFYYPEESTTAQAHFHRRSVEFTNDLARAGDFFVCANERQRDWWLGILAANGRINPLTFGQDASYRKLIDVAGIGLPGHAIRAGNYLRGKHAAFPSEAKIVLWGGGIWDWLDPLTIIRAWGAVIAQHPEARLVFIGTRHPNATVPRHRQASAAIALAESMGEKDRTIFFFDWLTYAEREALFSEADIGVSMHAEHIETRFAMRTRVIDYIWAGLPVLVSDGDSLAEIVRGHALGEVVDALNVQQTTDRLLLMLKRPKQDYQTQLQDAQAWFGWENQLKALTDYCLNGAAAADAPRTAKNDRGGAIERGMMRFRYLLRTVGMRGALRRLWQALRARVN